MKVLHFIADRYGDGMGTGSSERKTGGDGIGLAAIGKHVSATRANLYFGWQCPAACAATFSSMQ